MWFVDKRTNDYLDISVSITKLDITNQGENSLHQFGCDALFMVYTDIEAQKIESNFALD